MVQEGSCHRLCPSGSRKTTPKTTKATVKNNRCAYFRHARPCGAGHLPVTPHLLNVYGVKAYGTAWPCSSNPVGLPAEEAFAPTKPWRTIVLKSINGHCGRLFRVEKAGCVWSSRVAVRRLSWKRLPTERPPSPKTLASVLDTFQAWRGHGAGQDRPWRTPPRRQIKRQCLRVQAGKTQGMQTKMSLAGDVAKCPAFPVRNVPAADNAAGASAIRCHRFRLLAREARQSSRIVDGTLQTVGAPEGWTSRTIWPACLGLAGKGACLIL